MVVHGVQLLISWRLKVTRAAAAVYSDVSPVSAVRLALVYEYSLPITRILQV